MTVLEERRLSWRNLRPKGLHLARVVRVVLWIVEVRTCEQLKLVRVAWKQPSSIVRCRERICGMPQAIPTLAQSLWISTYLRLIDPNYSEASMVQAEPHQLTEKPHYAKRTLKTDIALNYQLQDERAQRVESFALQ